ncbi:T9SS type A sorting domain-containing protein [Cryomorphaceae bacterium 1068]|nr:T9SS type A sorting domain-containing protein [Cryomorphaceae bacterium 1068]
MKRLPTFLLILFSFQGFAQDEVEWFQPGQEWYYRVFCLTTIDCGTIHYAVVGEETIGGEEAAVLTRTEIQEGWNEADVRTEYLRYESDTVWRYSLQSEEWHMLFDFGAESGDVWTIQEEEDHGYTFPGEEPQDVLLFEVVVDSVDFWMEIPESPIQNRRVVYTSPTYNPVFSAFSFGLFTAPIIEGIGPVGSASDLIGNSNFVILPTYEARFQCFLENGELVYGVGGSPCFILSTDEVEQVDHGLIYPNPASESIFWDKQIDELRIFDARGKVVLQKNQIAGVSSVSISELERGFYTVVMTGGNGIFSQKLIVQ